MTVKHPDRPDSEQWVSKEKPGDADTPNTQACSMADTGTTPQQTDSHVLEVRVVRTNATTTDIKTLYRYYILADGQMITAGFANSRLSAILLAAVWIEQNPHLPAIENEE